MDSLVLGLLALLLAGPGEVRLAWDANTEADLAGYRVYHGFTPGAYSAPEDAGNVTTWTVTGLVPGKYFFAVTAYNAAGVESGYSNEVSTTVLAPPTGLQITSQSASLRWFGVVLLATTSQNASAILRYRKLEVGAIQQTVIATPDPIRTQHRAVLYLPSGTAYFSYNWTMTGSGGEVVTGIGTFQTR